MKTSRFLSALIILSMVVNGCKKHDDNNPGSVKALKTTVTPWEVVFLTVENLNLDKDSYTATFGKTSVTLVRDQNNLGFVVPQLTAGTYQLQLAIKDRGFTIDFEVKELPAISGIDQYIKDNINGLLPFTGYMDTLSRITSGLPLSADNAVNTGILKNYNLQFQNALNSATAEEKNQFALFIQANPELFTPLEDLTKYKDSFNVRRGGSAAYADDVMRQSEQRISSGLKILVAKCLVANACFLSSLGNPLVGLAGLVMVLHELYQFKMLCQIESFKYQQVATEELFIDRFSVRRGGSSRQFFNGRTYVFDITIPYRNLNKDDLNSKSTLLKSMMQAMDVLGYWWDKINGLVPTRLSGDAFHIKNVADNITANKAVNPTYLSISDLSNSNVTANMDNSGDKLVLSFASQDKTEQNFTFKINYNNPDLGAFSNIFDATLVPEDTAIMISGVFRQTSGTCAEYLHVSIQNDKLISSIIESPDNPTIISQGVYIRRKNEPNVYDYAPGIFMTVNNTRSFTFTHAGVRTCAYGQ